MLLLCSRLQLSALCLHVVFLLVSRQSASCAIAALQLPVLVRIIGCQFFPVAVVSTRDATELSRLSSRLLQVWSRSAECWDWGFSNHSAPTALSVDGRLCVFLAVGAAAQASRTGPLGHGAAL